MIIKLGKYNEVRELLIENRTTGSQGHVCYQDRGWRISVARAAVNMGVEEMGVQTRDRVHTISLRVRNESRYASGHCGAIKGVLACNKIDIDWKIKKVGTLRSQVHWLRGLPMRWCKWHKVA